MKKRKTNRIRRLTFILLMVILVIPQTVLGAGSQAVDVDANQSISKNRYTIDFYISNDQNGFCIKAKPTIYEFSTGERKTESISFCDDSFMPFLNGKKATNYKEQAYSLTPQVVKTPNGVKAYVVYYTMSNNQFIYTIYEYSFESKKLRKVVDISDKEQIGYMLYANAGLYKLKGSYYSLMDNKLMFKDKNKDYPGLLTNYSYRGRSGTINFTFQEQLNYNDVIFSEYDPISKQSIFYKVLFGGKRIKLNLDNSYANRADSKLYDPTSYELKIDSNSRIKQTMDLKKLNSNNFTNTKTIKIIKGSQSKIIHQETINNSYVNLDSFLSPNKKYLVIHKNHPSTAKNVNDMFYIYDLNNLKLVNKFKSPYRVNIHGITWATDDLFSINFYVSNPGRYPDISYSIKNNISFTLPFTSYYLKTFYDDFDYEGLISLNSPFGLNFLNGSKKGYIKYTAQGTFKLNGKYYVPLNDFTKYCEISFTENNSEITLGKNEKSTAVKKSTLLKINDRYFIPLGEWNKQLGITVVRENYMSHLDLNMK